MKQTGLENHGIQMSRANMASPFDFTKSVFAEVVLNQVPKGESSMDFEREVAQAIPLAGGSLGRLGSLILMTSLRSMETLRRNLPPAFLKIVVPEGWWSSDIIRQHKAD